MTLDDILLDIHALEDEMRTYERKYGVLTETFYESFQRGEEHPANASLRDWMAWSSAYELWTRRREQYRRAIQTLAKQTPTLAEMIGRTARHESLPIPA
jgi:hypothetical protein